MATEEKKPLTDGAKRSKVRAAVRQVWTFTTKAEFIRSIRVPYPSGGQQKWGVYCAQCLRLMGLSQKEYVYSIKGKRSAKPRIAYQVDHINGLPGFETWEQLGAYVDELLNGPMRILCFKCHQDITEEQKAEKKRLKK